MKIYRHIAIGLAAAILLSSARGPVVVLSAAKAPGVFGADVLDVQRVVSYVFGGTQEDPSADVNGDGCVDILDLQRMLALANTAETPAPVRPPLPEVPAVAPRLGSVFILGVLPRSRPFAAPAQAEAGQVSDRALEAEPARTVARYLYGLTPHAPPFEQA